jgi:hypothetical protein
MDVCWGEDILVVDKEDILFPLFPIEDKSWILVQFSGSFFLCRLNNKENSYFSSISVGTIFLKVK